MNSLGFPFELITIFLVFMVAAVWLDLRAHRNSTEISLKDATLWSIFWVGSALAFYYYLNVRYGDAYGSLFLQGYLLEKTLAVDNLFAFMAIFASFGVTGAIQHKVLYWGIMGAVVFRLVFVGSLTATFHLHWSVSFLFAAVVLWTAYAMLRGGDDDEEVDYTNHPVVRAAKKLFSLLPGKAVGITSNLVGGRFLIRASEVGRTDVRVLVTPLLLCLICIEACDIVFSFDSVPAIIAITQEPVLVYTAVMFAVLGLRNLYFVLDALKRYLCRLELFVAIILGFIGSKLAVQTAVQLGWLPEAWKVSPAVSLWIVLGLLVCGVAASVLFPVKDSDAGDDDSAVNGSVAP